MSEFNWQTYGRWEDAKLWENERRRHDDVCNCMTCHDQHDIAAQAGSPDFECCTNDLAWQIARGTWCAAKPKEHKSVYMDFLTPGLCLECEHEKKK